MAERISNRAKSLNKSGALLQTIESGIGKLPPQAMDLEEAVLGALMLDANAVNTVIDILQPKYFYKDIHGKIFEAIFKMFNRGEPIDILTVTHQLRKDGQLEYVGGSMYVAQLTNRVASTAHIEAHARIIAQKFMQRELISISTEIIHQSYEDNKDVFELLDMAEGKLFGLSEGTLKKNYEKMSLLLSGALKLISEARNSGGGISGIPTGFTDLDRLTGGWQRSDMIIVAARPSMGKTAFVLSMARNMAVDYQIPVAIFSLEMSSVQLVQRLISAEAEIEADKLRKGELAEYQMHQLHQRITKISDAPIFIDDTPALSIFELRAKCRRLKAQHGIQAVIIDYLQLMSAGLDNKNGNREQEISTISRNIKSIAKELEIPIIALSQLSRQVETRSGDKKPILSDLRESGAIEQDADIVAFLYRPEYYKLTEDDIGGKPVNGMAYVIIAKHRNGALDEIPLRFINTFAKFTNQDGFAGEFPEGHSQVRPNEGFLDSNGKTTITVSSKMNSLDDDDDDDMPFSFGKKDVDF